MISVPVLARAVPPAPNVTVLPTYSQNSSSLVSFLVTFDEQVKLTLLESSINSLLYLSIFRHPFLFLEMMS